MRRRLVIVAMLLASTVLVGAFSGAWAYFSGGGSGSGSGSTGTALAVTLAPATATAGLYPGGTTNVVLSASNPNTSAVRLATLSLEPSQGTGGFAVDAGHSGCAVGVLSFSTQNNGGSGWTVPAKVGAVNGTLSITLPNALAMTAAAANACQGATFTVYLNAGA